jgi:hypothetical protein
LCFCGRASAALPYPVQSLSEALREGFSLLCWEALGWEQLQCALNKWHRISARAVLSQGDPTVSLDLEVIREMLTSDLEVL